MVRQFAIMTVVWGIVGMTVGVLIAAQLVWPDLNFGLPWTSFGRLRPLHTNAVIFAFGGCALFATSYYAVQRHLPGATVLRHPRLLHLLGLATGDPAGRHQPAAGLHLVQGYAELEWPIDILITVVWVAYAVVFFGTLVEAQGQAHLCGQLVLRRVHLTVAMLHVVNNLEAPVTFHQVLLAVRRRHRRQWSSGGTGTTPWASSSPPASSA
ncbi:cbb3-type cytochrome c oxidase subunit I [Pseudomonas aeruginosa]